MYIVRMLFESFSFRGDHHSIFTKFIKIFNILLYFNWPRDLMSSF